jgi:biofilm PGA synthesis lipoprotein PgaB
MLEKNRPRLNGVQVFALDPSYAGDTGRFFDEVKAAGADTVFFRVFHNRVDRYHLGQKSYCGTGVYFRTDQACVINDMLAELTGEAHKRGIRLYAWMATRTLSFLKTDAMMEKTFNPDGSYGEGYGASIFNVKAREKITKLFEDLAAYNIDGILFQDDFIMRYSEGASREALAAYYADTGKMLSYDKLFGCNEAENPTKVKNGCSETYIPWAKWKTERMTEFFSELREAVLVRNPSVRFAANVYYETPTDAIKGISWYAQSLDKLLKAGFDYLAVMCYHDQIRREMNLSEGETLSYINEIVANSVKAVNRPERVLVKFQRISWKDKSGIDRGELERVCSIAALYGDVSRAIVPVDSGADVAGVCF